MKIQFTDPATGFSDGLDVIRAYHDDLLRQGERLLGLIAEIEAEGLNAERAGRLAQVYTYYQRATQLHHQDEEQALFPAVVGRDLLIDGMIERLPLDHEEIEEAWRVLEITLKEIFKRNRIPEHLPEKTARFERLLREHLLRENEDFLPQVELLFQISERRRMGKTMAAIRGVPS